MKTRAVRAQVWLTIAAALAIATVPALIEVFDGLGAARPVIAALGAHPWAVALTAAVAAALLIASLAELALRRALSAAARFLHLSPAADARPNPQEHP